MPASTSSQFQQYEPILRFVMCGLDQGMARLMGLPSTNYGHHLNYALTHMQVAMRALHAWAEAHEIQVHDSMPT